MLWGDKSVEDFRRLAQPGYAQIVLGFNEPNEPSQSNMSPGHAVELWWAHIEPLKHQGYTKFVAPACTNSPTGIQWMRDFMGACSGCKIDAVGVHFYGTSSQAMIDYLNQMHDTFGRNLWVTEFACQNFSGGAQCSWDQIFSFMRTVTGFMDGQPWIEQYFAFGMLHDMYNVNPANQLLGWDGHPTELGRVYLGLA